jgi:hypothetical protein
MNHEENEREDEKKVDQRSGHMEDNEGTDPCEKHQEREDEKNEAHEKFPPNLAILARFGSVDLERFAWRRIPSEAFL